MIVRGPRRGGPRRRRRSPRRGRAVASAARSRPALLAVARGPPPPPPRRRPHARSRAPPPSPELRTGNALRLCWFSSLSICCTAELFLEFVDRGTPTYPPLNRDGKRLIGLRAYRQVYQLWSAGLECSIADRGYSRVSVNFVSEASRRLSSLVSTLIMSGLMHQVW